MRQNYTSPPWKWTKRRALAAVLVAEDELTDDEIAGRVGIKRLQLWRWKQRPEFSARVAEIANRIGALALRRAIGRRGSADTSQCCRRRRRAGRSRHRGIRGRSRGPPR